MAPSSNRNRKAGAAPAPAQASPSTPTPQADTPEAPPPAIDSALDAWGAQAARDQLAWQINTCRALLRGAKAVREAQMQAAERAEAACLEAADQVLSARGIGDLGSLQLDLARRSAEAAMQHCTHLGEVVGRSWTEAIEEAAAGWTRMSTASWQGLLQWSRWQASLPASAEVVEAEVEHLTNPIAASPAVWPAQEAARQAMSLAASTWNDWLSWGGRLGEGQTRH